MQNINPKRGLSNGTPVTFHYLILDSRENQTTILEKMTSGNYEDIVLQYEPKYVLVNITNADPKDFIGVTAVEGQAVIPLPLSHTSKAFALNVPGQKGIQKHFFKTKSHGIDMGFSITLHKIQGQTCRRLIVDLNHRPFPSHISYSGFYVAVSRVRNGDDLRIMPLQPNVSDLNYLASLQPPKQLISWLNSYDKSGKFQAAKISTETEESNTSKRKKRIHKFTLL